MKTNISPLLITAHSITFLLEDGGFFNSKDSYDVFLNNEKVMTVCKSVSTLYDLSANTKYELEIKDSKGQSASHLSFQTKYEFLTINVKDLGASGDGVHDDTEFIQAAIMALPGDSRILIPKGKYLIGSLFLKSDINIELEEGAVLCAKTEREGRVYFPGSIKTNDSANDEYQLGTWEGTPEPMFAGILTGIGVKNVVIYGRGTVDGRAGKDNWWNNPKVLNVAYRPRLMFLNHCENIAVQGVLFENSPSWTIHPFFCKDLSFLDFVINNPKDSPNTDGINPESSENVEIAGVNFSLGDDCIAIKSGKIYMGQKYKCPSDHIHVHHCLMQDGHGAVTLGSEISGGVTNVLVEKCLFQNTDRGLRIKTRRGRGKNCFLNNIRFENIKMEGVQSPFTANMFYFCDADGHSYYVQSREKMERDERTPELGVLTFENIECTDAHICAGCFLGLPESKIEKVGMKNVRISFAKEAKAGVPVMCDSISPVSKSGIMASNVKELELINVQLEGYEGERLNLSGVDCVKEEENSAECFDRIEQYLCELMEQSTPDYPAWNIEKKRQGIKSTWNYIDGCMIKAVLEMYDISGDKKYLDFADSYIDAKVFPDGTIEGYDPMEHNLDNINEGKVLFTLSDLTHKEKYEKAIKHIFAQVESMPRTYEGNFWHKKIYPNQVWLDGLYMVLPFYMEYENRFENGDKYGDIFRQFKTVEKRMKDKETGLYYHAYDCSKMMFWADRETGLSSNFWLRALGWFAMAMLDTLEVCPLKESEDFAHIKGMFVNLMDSVCSYQDESGMWYQVVNLGERKGNYLETSGSAIMAYALLKGYRLGFLSKKHLEAGMKAFDGIKRNRLTVEDGSLHLTGICLMAGLGGKDNRDGSFEYYMSEPVVSDDAKGVGPFLLAYTEVLRERRKGK